MSEDPNNPFWFPQSLDAQSENPHNPWWFPANLLRIGIKKAGTLIGRRKSINFIEGSNITITITDDPTNETVDVQIDSTGGTGFQTLITSPTDNDIVTVDATGQTKDSGKAFSLDGTLASNSDNKIPTEKAIKTYVDAGMATKQNSLGYTPENVANKDIDGTLAANSDTKYASQKATKTYVDTGLATKQNSLGYTPENVANKDTDGTLAANSDTKYASQKAVKTYIDTGLATKQNSLGYTAENVANKDTDNTLAANSDTKYASQKAIKYYVDNKVFDYDNMPEEIQLAVVNSMRNSSILY